MDVKVRRNRSGNWVFRKLAKWGVAGRSILSKELENRGRPPLDHSEIS